MTELEREVIDIAADGATLAECFRDDSASYRWGLLTAFDILMSVRQAAGEDITYKESAILTAAQQAINVAVNHLQNQETK